MTSRAPSKGRPGDRATGTDPFFGPAGVSIRGWQTADTRRTAMTVYAIGSAQEHLAVRLELLDAEQALTR
jgi:hypothetical protein